MAKHPAMVVDIAQRVGMSPDLRVSAPATDPLQSPVPRAVRLQVMDPDETDVRSSPDGSRLRVRAFSNPRRCVRR
jgi:hypothetical protein